MKSILTKNALIKPARTRQILVSLLLFLLIFAADTTHAATLFWTGAHATSSDWSRGLNWNTSNAPVDGDTIVFPAVSTRFFNTNDISGLQLSAIRFTGAGGGYSLWGNGVTLTNGVTATNSAGGNTINLARVTLGRDLLFTVAQPLTTLTISSEVRLNGHDLTANTTGSLVLSGVISGDGNVAKTGGGPLTLSGASANTFTGDVFVNEGSLLMGKTGGLSVPHRLVVGDGLGGAQADIAASLPGDQVNEVTINSSGVWNLGNSTEEVSDLVLNEGGDVTTGVAGKLRLGIGADITIRPDPDEVTASGLSEISGRMELLGAHTIRVSEGAFEGIDAVFFAEISGVGGMLKTGPGDLGLWASNSFQGTMTVDGGDLTIIKSTGLGSSLLGTRVNNDARLFFLGEINDITVVDEPLTLDSVGQPDDLKSTFHVVGLMTWAGNITLLRNASVSVATNGELNLSGVISGAGGMAKDREGTLRLSGNSPNTYTGTTIVNEGRLELDKGPIGVGGIVAVPGRLIIGDGIGGEHTDVVRHIKDNQVNTVTINGSGLWDLGNHTEEVSDLDLNNGGDVTTLPTGLLRLGTGAGVTVRPAAELSSGYTSIISGKMELSGGSHVIVVGDDADPGFDSLELKISADISGTSIGGLTKEGAGELSLDGNNTFLGAVNVNAGDLWVGHASALGGVGTIGSTTVNNDAILIVLSGVAVGDEVLRLNSSGDPALRGIYINSWSGDIALQRDTRISVDSGGSFTLTGVISGAGGIVKEDTGTLILSGNSANTYAGVTTVNEGRLHLNKAGVNVAVPGALIIGDGTGGANADVVQCLSVNELGALSAVTVNGSGQFIAGQEEFGSLAGSGNVSVSGSLNPGADNTSTTFSGVISGTGAINKRGTGTLTLSGNNTLSGGMGITAGTLFVNGQQPAAFVLIQPAGTLGGSGRVGSLSSFAGGATVSPGASPGRLSSGNVNFGAGTIFRVELDGPVPATQHDQLKVFGTVNLGGARLQPVLNFIPTLGQPLVIIDNDGTEDVIDQFDGLDEGDTIRLNQIPFVISYEGGDGNDVTLTATNTSISFISTRVEAGNGNGVIDPNECNHLFVALMNETGGPLGVSRGVLDSATPGVVVTQQRSDYANFAALGIRTNGGPFQIRTAPDFECGRLIEFLLTITVTSGGGGTFTIPFTVPSGGAGTPVVFNNAVNTLLVDQGQLVSALNVSGAAPLVGKVAVSLHITHPSAGDLVLRLQSPSGTIVPLALNLGGTGDNYGGGCGNQANRTTFDDAAPVRIAAGTAPFIGSFTPDSPLAAFQGEDPNGDWKLLLADTVAGDTGELRCWSLLISPPACTDGGGQCETCVPNFSGRFNADMPSTTTRFVRNGVSSGCGSAKICPPVTTGARLFYRVHLITNTGPATCVSAVLNDLCRASNLRLHAAAYLNTYDPANPCANYLGDTGTELTGVSTSFSFAAPENAVIAIVVSSPVAATACVTGYLVQLHGLPCPPPTLHIAKTGNPDEVRLYWSTAYPDYDLQRTPNLNGAAPYPFVNVPFTPFVVNGDYSVTNSTSGADAYYRLRKP